MRKSTVLLLPFAAAVTLIVFALAPHAPAQAKKAQAPYKIEFDGDHDIEQLDASLDGKDKTIHVKVRFSITLDGDKIEKIGDDYKLVIEENQKRVAEVAVPKPVLSDSLSVILAVDTSGSMKEHGRMTQAREASNVFLSKLPARSECGLILFDHEIRERQAPIPILQRDVLMGKISAIEPRGGTAYLDAAYEGIRVLSQVPAGRDRALVLMTDGIDLNSKKAIYDVISAAKKERVRVYTIGIGEPGKLDQVNTVLVLDHSGSMKASADLIDKTPKIDALHEAGYRFVDSMSSVGRLSIVPFSSNVGKPQPFYSKKEVARLKSKIKGLKADGETALFDATYEAIQVLEAEGTRGKRAVVVMTDGIDNTSRRRVEEVFDLAERAKIPLYMLAFGRDGEIDDDVMRRMATATGGKYYHARNKDSLIEIFENLSIQLHDDGIDEGTLKQIAADTGGQYYPAKNVAELKLILETVSKNIQRQGYEVVFKSLRPAADGTERVVGLKLVHRNAGGTYTEVGPAVTTEYFRRGLVVAEMNPFVYLVLLIIVVGLIALPGLLRRSSATS